MSRGGTQGVLSSPSLTARRRPARSAGGDAGRPRASPRLTPGEAEPPAGPVPGLLTSSASSRACSRQGSPGLQPLGTCRWRTSTQDTVRAPCHRGSWQGRKPRPAVTRAILLLNLGLTRTRGSKGRQGRDWVLQATVPVLTEAGSPGARWFLDGHPGRCRVLSPTTPGQGLPSGHHTCPHRCQTPWPSLSPTPTSVPTVLWGAGTSEP